MKEFNHKQKYSEFISIKDLKNAFKIKEPTFLAKA